MKTLTREHCAKVLLEWSEHYLKQAQKELDFAQMRLSEENIRLRIAQAVEAERLRNDPDWGGGFGRPTAEQLFDESVKNLTLDLEKKARILNNNADVLEYIRDVVAKDIPTPTP
jgi:hypothetical protein